MPFAVVGRVFKECVYSFYVTFCRHFRTQIAPEKNKNGFKYYRNNDWQRGRRWSPEPKAVGSSPSWRTRLISIEIAEMLLFF